MNVNFDQLRHITSAEPSMQWPSCEHRPPNELFVQLCLSACTFYISPQNRSTLKDKYTKWTCLYASVGGRNTQRDTQK